MKGGYIIKDISLLKEKFDIIYKKGWIKAICGGHGAIGLTFESELNKDLDSNYFPDFYGLEIKCTSRFSKYPYSLFSVAFDGPTYPEINRVIELYGYNDYIYKDKKVLRVDLDTISNNRCGDYYFGFEICDDKLYLNVFDIDGVLVEKKAFVYLDTLIHHLCLKLNNLVIIHASKKKIDDEYYFRYYKLALYELISKDKFIELLKEGIIFATLESRIGKSGENEGKYKNKNLVFKIKKYNLEKLFIKKCEIDKDYCINRIIKDKNNNENNFFIMN